MPSYGDIATVRSLQAGRRRWFAVRSQPSKKQSIFTGSLYHETLRERECMECAPTMLELSRRPTSRLSTPP